MTPSPKPLDRENTEAKGYLAKVSTVGGEVIHLAVVPTRNRSLVLGETRTLCGVKSLVSAEGLADPVDCLRCTAAEGKLNLERRPGSVELAPEVLAKLLPGGPYVPRHRRGKKEKT
jgi:hypothetical protein